MLSASVPHATKVKSQLSTQGLVYIGTLNRSIRNPDRLLAIFAGMIRDGSIPDLQLHFYGETGDCGASFGKLRKETKARVHVHGLVSRDTAIEAMRSALAVINIGNTTSFQLPSKLVEYVASGRPIVNITSGSNDSSAEFLEGIAGVLTLSGDVSVSDEARMLAGFLRKCLEPGFVRDAAAWLAGFSVESVASSYGKVIKRVQGLA